MARTIRFEGGPAHGETREFPSLPSAHHIPVHSRPPDWPALLTPYEIPPVKVAVYVPHPSDPENVYVLDAKRSPGVDPEPRHDIVVDVCGGPEVTICGYKAALPASDWFGLFDQILDIERIHRLTTAEQPKSITFPIRFERD
jgi:hypothetical protein